MAQIFENMQKKADKNEKFVYLVPDGINKCYNTEKKQED